MVCVQYKKIMSTAVALSLLAVTGGCSEYLARRDSISFGAGDAKAHNAAVHMVDPWARHAFRTDMPTPGARAEKAMENYRKGDQPPPAAAAVGASAGPSVGSPGMTGAGQ